jgi:hypothetical protein
VEDWDLKTDVPTPYICLAFVETGSDFTRSRDEVALKVLLIWLKVLAFICILPWPFEMFHRFFPPDNHVHFNLTMNVFFLLTQERRIMRENYSYMYDV